MLIDCVIGKRGMLIAHRGAVANSGLRENTLEAFARAMRNAKCDGIEFDLRLTSDDEIVIHHDRRLKDGRCIDKTTYKELPAYIPTLAQVLDLCTSMGYRGMLNLELKEYNLYDRTTEILRHRYIEWGLVPSQLLITSFLHAEIIQTDSTGHACGWIMECFPVCVIEQLIVHNDYIVLKDEFVPWHLEQVRELLLRNASRTFLFTVNDIQRVDELRDKGFNVISDQLPFNADASFV
ncbi:hypothetical protein SARC_06830 [Sphaeroforma arctica JP610]|uniref:GP-PDE domain-containing protein n=1 Tax=Sphaeroforma arctica JP610 TaxID=667725 RepID=A0A0L0FVF3_9EUKA|nr:hypothetical protein SARC_06830 [Sphaeroforma arctica JP610]KNC80817.1 hypothetical protein SARC_06830 [Sphaeroforma arctica JP610]|eukprot:XP_014154719.1 hypothetical protein SARC_06830 [Sphaeroforma arctica JP610]